MSIEGDRAVADVLATSGLLLQIRKHLLGAVATVAAYIHARRASRVGPTEALRTE